MIVASGAAADEAIRIEIFSEIVFGPVDLVAPLKRFRRDKNVIPCHEDLNFTVNVHSALVSKGNI